MWKELYNFVKDFCLKKNHISSLIFCFGQINGKSYFPCSFWKPRTWHDPGQNSLVELVWKICADQNIQTEGAVLEGDNRSKPSDWFSGRVWDCRWECGQSGVEASSSPQGVQERKPLNGLRIQRCPAFLPPEPGRCWVASKASELFRAYLCFSSMQSCEPCSSARPDPSCFLCTRRGPIS